jgi:hypothetical protein
MAASSRSLRFLTRVALVLGVVGGFREAVGCNSADYSVSGPCTGSNCTCEQDPTLPRCKALNNLPETGADLPDGAFPVDAAEAAAPDAAETGTEAGPDDAGDEAG